MSTMVSVGSKVKSKNKQGCHPVTLLSLIYYLTVTQLSLASLKLFWDINKFETLAFSHLIFLAILALTAEHILYLIFYKKLPQLEQFHRQKCCHRIASKRSEFPPPLYHGN